MLLAAGTGALALFVLLVWLFGDWRAMTLGQGYVPMAPSTAIGFLLLASGIFLGHRLPSHPANRSVALLGIAATMILGLVALLQVFGIELPIESWFSPSQYQVDGIPVGRMSPLTAIMLLATALAVQFALPFFASRLRFRQTSAILAVLLLLISIFVLLSYVMGAPLLYSDLTIPMALPTALTFGLFSISIIITAGVDTWPLSLFTAEDLKQTESFQLANSMVTSSFLLFVLIIIATGYFYIKFHLASFRVKTEQELTAIADLKAAMISDWYKERLGDARVIFDNPLIQIQSLSVLNDPGNISIRQTLVPWLESLQKNYSYRSVALFSAAGNTLLVTPSEANTTNRAGLVSFQNALRAHEITVRDLHRDPVIANPDLQEIHLTIWIPVRSKTKAPTAGLWELQIDPRQFLYPRLQTWPTVSRTAETLLVRQEGNEVVFLNDLRHQSNTALALRFHIDVNSKLPASLAVLGKTGVFEGVDYRGKPVLAAARKISGTPWFLVSKVDQDEIYAPLRQRAWTVGILVLAMISITALVANILWRRRDNQWLKSQLDFELERLALSERIVLLNKQAVDSIFLLDQDWRFVEVNNAAIKNYGYTLAEFKKLQAWEIRAPETRDAFTQQVRLADLQQGVIFETIHQRKDGSQFPVEISMKAAELGGKNFYQAFIRDITGRKKMEKNLEANASLLRSIIDSSTDLIFVKNRELRTILCNEAFARSLGKRPAELIGQTNVENGWNQELVRGNPAMDFSGFEQDALKVLAGETMHAYCEPANVSGKIRFLDTVKLPLRDKDGVIIGVLGISRDITDRKLAEDAIRRQGDQAQMYLDIADVMLCALDETGAITMINAKGREILGYGPEEKLIGLNWFMTCLPSPVRSQVLDVFTELMTGDIELLEYFENPVLRRTGEERLIAFHNKILRDDSGLITGILFSGEDITERRQAESALREKTDELDTFFNMALDLLCIADTDGYFKKLNPAWTQTLGYSIKEMTGQRFLSFVHPDDIELTINAIAELAAGQGTTTYVNRYQAKDGDYRYIEWRAAAKGTTIYAAARDITERRRVEKALRDSEYRYRQLFENMANGVAVYEAVNNGADFIFKDMNLAGQHISRIDKEKIIGKSVLEVFPNIKAIGLFETIQRVYQTGKPEHCPFSYYQDNRIAIWMENEVYKLPTGEVVVVYDDVTERKQAEEALKQLTLDLENRVRERTAQLENVNRELEAFSYSVSHDLRAPLRHLTGFVNLLNKQSSEILDEKHRHYLAVISDSAVDMGNLIDEILAFSRMGRIELLHTNINMDTLLAEALQLLEQDRKGRDITWSISPLPQVNGDPAMLRTVMVNLISNALKFTEKKPKATIEIGAVTDITAPEVVFYVKDNGAGFDMHYADKLFGLFQRLHRTEEFDGTGVGLANIRRIIERHGGRTWAEGTVNEGATFFFSLPRQRSNET